MFFFMFLGNLNFSWIYSKRGGFMENILRKRYDYLCKEVLSYKFVFATIMKDTLKEFEEYTIEEIINLIGNNENERVIGI